MPNAVPSKAEQRRQHTLERRRQLAKRVVTDGAVAASPTPSFVARARAQALPLDLVRAGNIVFEPTQQPTVALYRPALLAPNPQRGRITNERLDELAASLDAHGQQEPLLCRLITAADRRRWPDAFTDRQILLILKGHRVYFAQPKTKLSLLRVELLAPVEGEDDIAYARRALHRASIKMMHSQEYTLLDKVNMFDIWRREYAIEQPKKAEIAAYFEISPTEAQRIKTVAEIDESVGREIINSGLKPADEVIYLIANRPPAEHQEAWKRYGHLTVAEARRLLKEEQAPPTEVVRPSGRPRAYSLPVRLDDSPITYISTNLSPHAWKRRGGARAFWNEVRRLVNDRELQERLQDELG